MNNNISTFQIILMGVFVFFLVAGLVIFSTYKGAGGNGDGSISRVTIWGTVDKDKFNNFVNNANSSNPSSQVSVDYIQKSKSSFDRDFVEAIANGNPPDAIFADSDTISKEENRLITITFDTIKKRDYLESFIDGASVFLRSNGVLALPLSVDPIVLFYNKDLFRNAGVLSYPKNWTDVYNIVPKLTNKDESGIIKRSAISLGEYRNIDNASDVLSLLIFQSGGEVFADSERGLTSYLNNNFDRSIRPSDAGLRFYSEFANPSKSTYSWNRTLPESKKMFATGDLAMMLGYSSDISRVSSLNPNLRFDIAPIPQNTELEEKVTFGSFYGFAIPKVSRNINAAFGTISLLTGSNGAKEWGAFFDHAPARRELYTEDNKDVFKSVIYESGIITKNFINPIKEEYDASLGTAIENVISGKESVSSAINRIHDKFISILANLKN